MAAAFASAAIFGYVCVFSKRSMKCQGCRGQVVETGKQPNTAYPEHSHLTLQQVPVCD